MCGLFASFDKNMFELLGNINSARGSHSFSITYIQNDLVRRVMDAQITKFEGAFHLDGREALSGFVIGHIQAPTTTARDTINIHPASTGGALLWHNGLIKSKDVTRLQEKQGVKDPWDTSLLLTELQGGGCETISANLSVLDGSFACFYMKNGELFVFRNEIGPLFYNDGGDFSSLVRPGMVPVPANVFFRVDLDFGRCRVSLREVCKFTTYNNPYFMQV